MNIHSNWIKQIKVKNFKFKKLKNSKVQTRNYLSIARKCIVLFCSCSHKLPPLLQDITWSGLPWWPVPVYLLIVCIWDSSFCQRNEAGLMEGHLLRTVRVSQHGGWDAPQTTQEPLRISAHPTTFIASIQSVPDKKDMDALSVASIVDYNDTAILR